MICWASAPLDSPGGSLAATAMRRVTQAPAASWYTATGSSQPAASALVGKSETDVLIIGGGFAGLNTAVSLLERGFRDFVLLEAESMGHGASGRNGGFAFGGWSLSEASLLARFGQARAQRLYAGSRSGVAMIRQRIAGHAIDCQANEGGVLWVDWFRSGLRLDSRRDLLAKAFDTYWEPLDRQATQDFVRSDRYHRSLLEPDALHLHPLRYAQGLAAVVADSDAILYENSAVLSIGWHGGGWRAHTAGGQIDARRLVLACGGYLGGIYAPLERALLPIATYVMVTEPLGAALHEAIPGEAAIYDSRFAFDYYRRLPDDRLLWGGRISILDRDPDAVTRLLRRDLARIFPQFADAAIDYAWSGLMGYSRDEMPFIGELEPGLWSIQGFGGHGVAPTAYGGDLLAAALTDEPDACRDFASLALKPVMGAAGLVGAQARYSWLQFKDALAARD